jgi:hypothetical protein
VVFPTSPLEEAVFTIRVEFACDIPISPPGPNVAKCDASRPFNPGAMRAVVEWRLPAAPGSVWLLCAAPWQLACPLATAGATPTANITVITTIAVNNTWMRLICAPFTKDRARQPCLELTMRTILASVTQLAHRAIE